MTTSPAGLPVDRLVSFGQAERIGFSVSFTVTLNEQLAVLLWASVTEHVTFVVPFGKEDPDSGLQVGAPTPGQLSLTDGSEKLTVAEHVPGSLLTVVSA